MSARRDRYEECVRQLRAAAAEVEATRVTRKVSNEEFAAYIGAGSDLLAELNRRTDEEFDQTLAVFNEEIGQALQELDQMEETS